MAHFANAPSTTALSRPVLPSMAPPPSASRNASMFLGPVQRTWPMG